MFHSQIEVFITCSGLDATACIFLPLFITIRYASLFAIDDYIVFAIRYVGFPDTSI